MPVSEKKRDDARKCIEQIGKGLTGPAMQCVSDRPDKTYPPLQRSPGGCAVAAMQFGNMAKKMLIDATHAEETRVVVVDGNKVEEFDFESENKRQLAGNIYLAKVTRVEPSLQAAFVEYGGNRHGFLAFSEIHPDYYQIPVADRQALMEEERAYAEAQKAKEDEDEKPKRRRSRSRTKAKAEDTTSEDAVATKDVESDQIGGMETIDLDDSEEGSSPMERVAETPVEEPEGDDASAEAAQTADASDDHVAQAASEDASEDDTASEDGDDDDDDDAPRKPDASSKDDTIESVADDDDHDDIRPVRKPRPRRYKIQEVIKVRQILLVQVVKEERGNKGAALTTYLSLAGRYCVLMPNTARGGGISRKITNAADRKKLKEIANEIEVPQGAGLIVRTTGAKRTKAEIKRDYEYLQRLWEQIRKLTLESTAPAKIYEEGDLIKRSIRDLYNREIDEVLVEGERGYRIAKDFMKMIMPSHAKNVKHYAENERKNNAAVEKRMKDKLKTDRARIQVGRISGFGLMEMSRQRLRPGMIEATTQPCPACHGTGLIRSDDNLALSILRQIEEEGTRKRSREVLIKAPVGIANFLMNQKREHIAHIEARYGLSVRIEGDPMLVSPDFSLEKFKTATRVVPVAAQHVVSVDTSLMDQVDADDEEIPAEVAENTVETPNTENNVENDGEDRPKRRRRRRRRRNKNGNGEAQTASDESNAEASDAPTAEAQKEAEPSPESPVEASAAKTDDAPAAAAEQEEAPAKPKRTRSRTRKPKVEVVAEDAPEAVVKTETAASVEEGAPAEATEEAPAKPKRKRASRAKKADPVEAAPDADAAPVAPEVESASVEEEPAPAAPAPEPAGAEPEPVAAEAAPEPAKPKRRGWWSIGG